MHDAEEDDVSKDHTATDADEIELHVPEAAPAEGSPGPFIKRRLSMASGMTVEGADE